MNIIICDDRIDDRKNVSDLLSDYGEKKNYEFTITEYDSGEQLCEEQSALEACQLLFLDINMQGMDGLKTAMRIKEKYPKLPVVLVTAYMNYALDGYKVKASRFLLKDNLADTIEECMDDLIAEINKNRRILEFRFVEGTIKLYADDIIYIETELHKNGYFTMLQSVSRSSDILSLVKNWNVDGMILVFPTSAQNLEKLMDAANCPIATFDSNYSHPNLINVISDDEKGLYLSTKYMINHGHTEIAFVADYEGNIVLTKRFNGYKKALEDSHIPFRPEYIFSYPPSYEGGIEAGRAIAGSKSPITAVVTTADICAIGIMEGARLGGYRVPIDLSVIGYDNLNLCQYTVPKLTSVSQNVPKKARLATELLLKKIHDNESDSNLGEIMDVEIVDRQSVISLY